MSDLASSPSPFLLYTAADGKVKVEVYIKEETVWLTQKAIAELFGVKTPAINKHLTNIFETGELNKEATISIMEIVQIEGSRIVNSINHVTLTLLYEALLKNSQRWHEAKHDFPPWWNYFIGWNPDDTGYYTSLHGPDRGPE